MAYEFPDPDFGRIDHEADLDALMVPQFEDLWKGDRHEGPDDPADLEHQEFLAPAPPAADFPNYETDDTLPAAFPTFDAVNDPPDRGVPERGPVVSEWPGDPEGGPLTPHNVQGDHELPDQPDLNFSEFAPTNAVPIGDPTAGEAGQVPYIPWAFPFPAEESESGQPQEFGAPGEAEEGEPYQAEQPQGNQSQMNAPAFDVPQPVDMDIPAYQQPAPPQVEMAANEDLFARTGWPVLPPRIAQTHWMM